MLWDIVFWSSLAIMAIGLILTYFSLAVRELKEAVMGVIVIGIGFILLVAYALTTYVLGYIIPI